MASYGVNIIDFSLIKQYKNTFAQEKSKFNNTTYKTFSSSYIKTCSDSNIRRMSNNLDTVYKKIQKGYNSIDKWWEEYNKNAEGLENSLSNYGLSGITKSSLRSFVSANLEELPDYKSNLTSSFNYNQIVSSFNSKFSNNSVGIATTFASVDSISKTVSDRKIESNVSKIEDFNISDIGAIIATGASNLNEWLDNKIEDVNDFFEDTKAKIVGVANNVKSKVTEILEDIKQTLIDTFAYISNKVKNLWNKFFNWLMGDALPWISNTYVVINDMLESVAATIATFTVSLVEGLAQFGEAMVDFGVIVGAGVGTAVFAIEGLFGDENWKERTKQLWQDTKGFVSKNYVKSAFDNFYQNNSFGQWLASESYGFDTVRSIGSGLGYVGGVILLSVVTCGVGTAVTGASVSTTATMSIIAGLAGTGKGTQTAWENGADIKEGLLTGAATGVWEGIQFYLGAKIGQTSIFGKATTEAAKASLGTGTKLLDSVARIVLDGVDGGVEGFVQPLLDAIYKDSYIDENGNLIQFTKDDNILERATKLFDESGGWANVGIQTAIGLGGSIIGETFDLGKLLKNKPVNTKATANMEIVESVCEDIEIKIKDIYNGKLSLPKAAAGMVAAPLNLFSRFKHSNVIDNVEISNKVLNDGIYHFTSLDSAAKILDSGYVKESDYFVSYGKKKSFFFAGIPTVEDLAVNVRGLEPKRVAVKFNVDADNLVDFKYREFADKAISYEGRYNFDKSKASIAYLGLFQENGELVYKEISKADFDNYKCDISTNKLATSINNYKSTMVGIGRELDYFTDNLGRLKNLFSEAKVKETGSNIFEDVKTKVNIFSKNVPVKEKFSNIDIKAYTDEYNKIINSLSEEELFLINNMKNGSPVQLEPRLVDLHKKITDLENKISVKDNLIQKQPIKLKDRVDVAEFFEDPKQIMYNKVDELCNKFKLEQEIGNYNEEYQYFTKLNYDLKHTVVNNIGDAELFKNIEKYLTLDEISKIKKMYSDPKNATNVYSEFDKTLIQVYTFAAGPAVTAYTRKAKTNFKGTIFDGTNSQSIQEYLKLAINTVKEKKYGDAGVPKKFAKLLKVTDPDDFIKAIDKLIDKGPPLKDDIIVYRKVDSIFDNGQQINNFKPGTRFVEPAYSSCSVLDIANYSNRKISLEIEVPKGSKGAYIESFTGVTNYGQQEFLLGRNQTFEITDYPIYKANGNIVLKVKVVDAVNDLKLNLSSVDAISNPKLHLPSFEDIDSNIAYKKHFSDFEGGKAAKEIIDNMSENKLMELYNKAVNEIYEQKLYDGPKALAEHDYEHVKNVLLYSINIANDLDFYETDMNLLIDAAKYHDLGVVNASSHKNHSILSAKAVAERFGDNYTNLDLSKLQAIIEYHEKADVVKNGNNYYMDYNPIREVCNKYGITNESDINTVLKIGNVLKDADALDRTRFPGNIDINYFRNKESLEYLNASYEIREGIAKQQLSESLNNNKYTDEEKNEIFKLINAEYPDFIVNFSSKYYKNLKFNSIIDCAESIMKNKRF